MSVELELNVEGLEELQRKLESLGPSIKDHVHDALIEQGEILKNTAQAFAPRRTGYLESTIYAKVENLVLKVGASAPYAVFLELGTRFIQSRRFLARAFEYCLPGLLRRISEAVDQAIQEVSA